MTANVETVRRLWSLFAQGRFLDARPLLADTFVADWPVTRERMSSPELFLQAQIEYPGTGTIDVINLVDGGEQVFTQCTVNWNNITFTALSLFRFDSHGKINAVTEWWPDESDPPAGREHLTERY